MNKIRTVRLEKLMTQKQLACYAGISQSYLNELEKGKKKNPSISTLNKIAGGLNVQVNDLLESESVKKFIKNV